MLDGSQGLDDVGAPLDGGGRPAARRGLLPGDRGVLLEHEPARVARGVEQSTTSPIRASPWPSGRNSPARVACTSVSSPAPQAWRDARVDVLEVRVHDRGRRVARTNSAGSAPPISRCPVSRHQRRLGAASIRSTSSAVSTWVPGVRVQRERQPVLLDPPLDLREMAREPLEVARASSGDGGGPGLVRRRAAATNTSAPARPGRPRSSRPRRSRAPARAARAARSRRRAAARGGRAARGSPPARTAGSRSARARSPAGRAPPSPRRRARDRAGRPSPGPRRRPTRSGARQRCPVRSPIPPERLRSHVRLERSNGGVLS